MIDACELQLILLFDLVDFHSFLCFKVNPLLLELVTQLSLCVTCNNCSLLVFAHLNLQLFFKLGILFEHAFDFFLQLLVIEHPFVLLSPFLLKLTLQLSFFISPLLLLLSIFLFYFFSQITLPFSFCLSLFPFILPFNLQILQRLKMFFFEQGDILMQLSNLIIFKFIGGGKFTQLLVKESDVCLVFAIQSLLFIGQLSQGLLDIIYLIAVSLSMSNLVPLQLLNRPLTVSYYTLQLLLPSLKLFHLKLYLQLLLDQQSLQLFSLIPQSLNEILIVGFHGLNINCMQTGQPFLHVVKLFLVLSLPLVYLLLQQLYFIVQLIPFLTILLQINLQLILQVLYLAVFYLHQLSQTLKLSIEFLILLAHIGSQVTDLLIEDLLEFIFDLIDFFILLLHHCQKLLPISLDYFLETNYFILFLTFYSLVFFIDCVISCGFLLYLLRHSGNLKFILFFCLIEVSLDPCKFLLHFLVGSILFFSCDYFHPFFSFECFLFPNFYLLQESEFVVVVLITFGASLLEKKGKLFILCPQFEQLFLFLRQIFLRKCLLLEEQIVFNLKIFSTTQPQPRFIELITYRKQIFLEPFSLPPIEIRIMFGRRHHLNCTIPNGRSVVYFKLSHGLTDKITKLNAKDTILHQFFKQQKRLRIMEQDLIRQQVSNKIS